MKNLFSVVMKQNEKLSTQQTLGSSSPPDKISVLSIAYMKDITLPT